MGKPIEKQPVVLQGKASAKVDRFGPTIANAKKQNKSQDTKLSGKVGGKVESGKGVEGKGAGRQEAIKTRSKVENSGNNLKSTADRGVNNINKVVQGIDNKSSYKQVLKKIQNNTSITEKDIVNLNPDQKNKLLKLMEAQEISSQMNSSEAIEAVKKSFKNNVVGKSIDKDKEVMNSLRTTEQAYKNALYLVQEKKEITENDIAKLNLEQKQKLYNLLQAQEVSDKTMAEANATTKKALLKAGVFAGATALAVGTGGLASPAAYTAVGGFLASEGMEHAGNIAMKKAGEKYDNAVVNEAKADDPFSQALLKANLGQALTLEEFSSFTPEQQKKLKKMVMSTSEVKVVNQMHEAELSKLNANIEFAKAVPAIYSVTKTYGPKAYEGIKKVGSNVKTYGPKAVEGMKKIGSNVKTYVPKAIEGMKKVGSNVKSVVTSISDSLSKGKVKFKTIQSETNLPVTDKPFKIGSNLEKIKEQGKSIVKESSVVNEGKNAKWKTLEELKQDEEFYNSLSSPKTSFTSSTEQVNRANNISNVVSESPKVTVSNLNKGILAQQKSTKIVNEAEKVAGKKAVLDSANKIVKEKINSVPWEKYAKNPQDLSILQKGEYWQIYDVNTNRLLGVEKIIR